MATLIDNPKRARQLARAIASENRDCPVVLVQDRQVEEVAVIDAAITVVVGEPARDEVAGCEIKPEHHGVEEAARDQARAT